MCVCSPWKWENKDGFGTPEFQAWIGKTMSSFPHVLATLKNHILPWLASEKYSNILFDDNFICIFFIDFPMIGRSPGLATWASLERAGAV